MRFMQKQLALVLGLASTLIASVSAQSISFDGDLTDWTSMGDAAAMPGYVIVTNAYADLPGDDNDSNEFNVSGSNPVSNFDIEQFAGLNFGDLDMGDAFAMEGSAIQRTFTVAAGESFSFDFVFATNDLGGSDYAFVAYNGMMMSLASATDAVKMGAYGYEATTGWMTYTSEVFTLMQEITLTIGVLDLNDTVTSSGLVLGMVPEPSTSAALAGLAVLGLVALRRRQA